MYKQYFLERALKRPNSTQESYNYHLVPETFLATDDVAIECIRHGVFQQRAASHLHGSGCPKCGEEKSSNGRAISTEDFIERSKKIFGSKFGYEKTEYVRGKKLLTLTCDVHGDIVLSAYQHLNTKYGCLLCGVNEDLKRREKKVWDDVRKRYGEKYDYSRISFKNVLEKVEIICPQHGSFFQDLYSHSFRGNECPNCSRDKRRVTLSEFVKRSREIHGTRYNYDKVSFKTTASEITITCPKHGDWTQRVQSHLSGNGCKKCFLEENILSAEVFIDNAREVHGDKYDYSKVVYRGNKIPVEIICPTHGSFLKKPNSHISSRSGCQLCQESKGEVAVEVFLKKYGIPHLREYRIKPHLYRFDFYLPETNLFIEFHGKQHYEPIALFGGEASFLDTRKRDDEKKLLVKSIQGTLIVLTYLNLSDGSLEKELKRRLKRIYRYWFEFQGKVVVFRNETELAENFKIPKDVLLRDFVQYVIHEFPEYRILF